MRRLLLIGWSESAHPGRGHLWELRCEVQEETNIAKIIWQHASHKRKSLCKDSELGIRLTWMKGQTGRAEWLRYDRKRRGGVHSGGRELQD